MSADIRLDPATLRWCAAHLRNGLMASIECTMNNTVTLGAYEDAEEAVDLATSTIEAIEAAASEARPPLLSDWIKACEGAALGDPSFEAEGDGISAYFSSNGVTVYLDGMGRETWLWDTVETTRCATPAELRAALARLAAEASK